MAYLMAAGLHLGRALHLDRVLVQVGAVAMHVIGHGHVDGITRGEEREEEIGAEDHARHQATKQGVHRSDHVQVVHDAFGPLGLPLLLVRVPRRAVECMRGCGMLVVS